MALNTAEECRLCKILTCLVPPVSILEFHFDICTTLLSLIPLGNSHTKRTGLLVDNFENNPEEEPRSSFVGMS